MPISKVRKLNRRGKRRAIKGVKRSTKMSSIQITKIELMKRWRRERWHPRAVTSAGFSMWLRGSGPGWPGASRMQSSELNAWVSCRCTSDHGLQAPCFPHCMVSPSRGLGKANSKVSGIEGSLKNSKFCMQSGSWRLPPQDPWYVSCTIPGAWIVWSQLPWLGFVVWRGYDLFLCALYIWAYRPGE